MKRIIAAAVLTLMVSLQMMAGRVIKNPVIEFSATWMEITEIELTKEATIVRATLNSGAAVISNTMLTDRNTGKEYKLLRVEGINVDERSAGRTPCSIYFEPLDAKVKELNYIEEGNNPTYNFYGIKLKEKGKAGKGTKDFDPESLNYDYYMSQPFTPDTAWHFSNEPYKNLFEAGKALVKIHVKPLPKEIADITPPTAIARITNQITRNEENSLATMDENNCYTFELDLPYQQFIFLQPFGNIFIAPGDTLEVFSTLEQAVGSYGPRFMTFRGNSESAVINTLQPEFMEKYGRKEYDYEKAEALIGRGKEATQSVLERWANQVNEIIADEEFRQALINSPLSTMGKDIIMMSAVANKCVEIEDVVSHYGQKGHFMTQMEDGNWFAEPNPDYVPLDKEPIYGTLMKNKEIIYNNTIALCERSQWVFTNRTLYGPLLWAYDYTHDEQGAIIDQRRRDDYGMAGTFMNDLYISQDVTRRLKETLKEDKLGRLAKHRSERLGYVANDMGKALAGIQNEKVAQTVVGEYRNFVKATETSTTDDDNNWTEEQNALWNKIVSPYKGNTLILDFWAMSCGPCRSGMMGQRKIVEELKDEKIKFLYITTEDERGSGEKWMGDNNIKGEHIYITNSEWRQFETMINFNAIPRCVLVSKEGKLIDNDFHFHNFNSDDLKKLAERF